MKKQNHKKLVLDRETIQPLQAEALEAVNGGLTPALIIGSAVAITLFFCAPQQAR